VGKLNSPTLDSPLPDPPLATLAFLVKGPPVVRLHRIDGNPVATPTHRSKLSLPWANPLIKFFPQEAKRAGKSFKLGQGIPLSLPYIRLGCVPVISA